MEAQSAEVARGARQISEQQQLMEEQQTQLEALSGPASSHVRVRQLEAQVFRGQETARALQVWDGMHLMRPCVCLRGLGAKDSAGTAGVGCTCA